jgi:peptidylprolyl isomerase
MTKHYWVVPAFALAALCLTQAAYSDDKDKDKDKKEITTKSGLKYQDLKEGKGAAAKEGDLLTVRYTGWLTDGTKFDSNADKEKPFTFRLGVGEVIQGWDEGVAGMKAGGKRKLTIPPELAYGKRASGKIPANSTLVFEVELIQIVNEKNSDTEKDVKIEDLKEGGGDAAKKGDKVEAHYTGWLTDGTKFDSSPDREKPITFTLGAGEVIKGWDKGLVGMKVGGKRKLTIPPELAYGKKGNGTLIPPDATLVFEVELVRIIK